jgi:hypothetical protein
LIEGQTLIRKKRVGVCSFRARCDLGGSAPEFLIPQSDRRVCRRERRADDLAVFADEDFLEERLVEDPALKGPGAAVGRVRRAGPCKRLLKLLLQIRRMSLCLLEELRRVPGLGIQAVLFLRKNLVGYETLVRRGSWIVSCRTGAGATT